MPIMDNILAALVFLEYMDNLGSALIFLSSFSLITNDVALNIIEIPVGSNKSPKIETNNY